MRTVTDYFIKWKGKGPESSSWVQEDLMERERLQSHLGCEHINQIATDCPQANIIIDAEYQDDRCTGPREEWKYLVQQADDPQYGPCTKMWYLKSKIPHLQHLINKYWEKVEEEMKLEMSTDY